MPLPEDYQAFDETAKEELLGYYRGDSAWRVSTESSNEITEYVDKNGLIIQEFQYQETPSNHQEDFSKRMNEHILVRLALDYKIKIWPKNHIRFSVTTSGYASGGLEILSQ